MRPRATPRHAATTKRRASPESTTCADCTGTPCVVLRLCGALGAGARGDAIGVEDRLDRAQAVDRRVERLRVRDLDDEAVLDHRRVRRATRLDDVDAGLGERP